jgi:RNA polymerase sigma-70 factor (ECF subfamily)
MTDEDLVDLVCKGETRRFEELVHRHQDAVYSMALRYARSEGDAEDIAQEAFLRAFRSLDSFRHEAKFSTWLFRITYNLCVDWVRRNTRRHASERVLEEGEEIVDRRFDVETGVIEDMQRIEIRSEVSSLAERYRTVIMMYYYDGSSYEEIGKMLGVPPKTVETRLYRARRLMRKGLGRRGRMSK